MPTHWLSGLWLLYQEGRDKDEGHPHLWFSFPFYLRISPLAEHLSCFNTCTATLNLSRYHSEELYVRTHMSMSVGPDIKWTLSCHLHKYKVHVMSAWADMWLKLKLAWRIHSEQVGVLMTFPCLLHALPRRHPSPKSNRVFPVGENASDTDNLLLCATCVKGQLLTMCGPDSLDTVGSSYEKTTWVWYLHFQETFVRKLVVACGIVNLSLRIAKRDITIVAILPFFPKTSPR